MNNNQSAATMYVVRQNQLASTALTKMSHYMYVYLTRAEKCDVWIDYASQCALIFHTAGIFSFFIQKMDFFIFPCGPIIGHRRSFLTLDGINSAPVRLSFSRPT
jgi:hypothetical protein